METEMTALRQKLLTSAYHMSCRSRQMKFDLFWREIAPRPGSTMLNIGADSPIVGAVHYGGRADGIEQPEQDERFLSLRIFGCNLLLENMKQYRASYASRGWTGFVGDGCRLPFADQSIDVVFSNAVIEHVPRELQPVMASEIMRVGRSWFITTPNFWFPIELHRRFPLFQFLPQTMQDAYDRRFNPFYDGNQVNLLSASDMRRLFPGTRVVSQRVTFMPETLIAYRRGQH
jgi:SAM-dependent methyltransferase